jgi:hypothetical protein
MNPADEEAAKLVPTQGPSPCAVAGSHDNLKEQIHSLEEQLHEATLKDLQRANHQSKPAEDLHGSDDRIDEQLRVSVEELLHLSLRRNRNWMTFFRRSLITLTKRLWRQFIIVS